MSSSLISSLTNSCVKHTLYITQQGNYTISLVKLFYNPHSIDYYYEVGRSILRINIMPSWYLILLKRQMRRERN